MRSALLAIVVAGLMALAAYHTKPTPEDFYRELQSRAARAAGGRAVAAGLLPKGGNSLDQVVRRMSPEEAMRRAEHSDYGLVSVFTVETLSPEGTPIRVYATGLYGTFVVMSDDEG